MSVRPFYIYPDAAYDQSAALECKPSWIFDDQSAEVAMLNLLRKHPSRVHDPAAASLFVVPLMPYVSSGAGECMGETHEKRMSKAAAALRHSPWLARKHGHDHLLITNTFRVKLFGPWLKPLLQNATVAWFEQPKPVAGGKPKGVLYSLAFWRCTVVIPYLANPFCQMQRDAAPDDARRLSSAAGGRAARRRARVEGSIFFQGSWAAAANLRRHFTDLQQLPGSHIHDVPRGCNSPDNATSPVCVASRARGSRLQTARGMLSHEFCLVPRGDTPSSGRLFAALACRCVPLVLSNRFPDHYPFRSRGRYDEWTVALPEGEFLRDPRAVVQRGIAAATPRLAEMRAAMDAVSAELLYDDPRSRAAENLLREVGEQCATVADVRPERKRENIRVARVAR